MALSFSTMPAEIRAYFFRFLDNRSLIALSRADRLTNIVVLREFERRLKLDLPADIPNERLGAELKATVENLRETFRIWKKEDQGYFFIPFKAELPGLRMLVGFIPDFREYPVNIIVGLRSLELLQYRLQRATTSNPPPWWPLSTLINWGKAASQRKQLRMVSCVIEAALRDNLQVEKEYRSKLDGDILLSFLCPTLRQGNLDFVKKIEGYCDLESRQKYYAENQLYIFIAVHASNTEIILQHVISSLREIQGLRLDYRLVRGIHRMEPSELRTKILNFALTLPCDSAEILKEAYSTQDVAYITIWRDRLDVKNNPISGELAFALETGETGNHTVVDFAFRIIDRGCCNILAATRAACKTYNFNVFRTLLQIRLFQLDDPTLLRTVLLEAEKQNHFEQLVELILDNLTPHLFLENALTPSDLLRAAYKTKNLKLIERARNEDRVKSAPPDPHELKYACETGETSIVEYALKNISPESDLRSASEAACEFPAIAELLITQKIFNVSKAAEIERLFQRVPPSDLERFIASIDLKQPLHIIGSSSYIKAKKQVVVATIVREIGKDFERDAPLQAELEKYFEDHCINADPLDKIVAHLLRRGCNIKSVKTLKSYTIDALLRGHLSAAHLFLQTTQNLLGLFYYIYILKNMNSFKEAAHRSQNREVSRFIDTLHPFLSFISKILRLFYRN